jgi:hypothetical protein
MLKKRLFDAGLRVLGVFVLLFGMYRFLTYAENGAIVASEISLISILPILEIKT